MPEFILFPMIHVGSRAYYDEVYRRLSECDLIFVEGVKSKKVAFLTFSYKIVQKIKRLELVTQQTLKISDFGDKAINTDMDARAFDTGWASIPVHIRWLMFLAVPFYALYLYLFGTKNLIAERLAVDDLPSRDEILNYDEDFEKYDRVIIDERDQKLIEAITRFYEENQGVKRVVGILYGAAHMRGVSSFLRHKLHYRVVKAEWITVFNL
jgi:pheromone shutdown protein TraB